MFSYGNIQIFEPGDTTQVTLLRVCRFPPIPTPLLRAGVIPMTCDHPAWSPRAARGVVRDPRRFRAAFTLSEAKGSE
ncbi:MAG: hypothetical protein KatS3mg058_2745 [Roseiflexus sp.]|nr:MAG: hypothetical protein KatS3mg058_2745 [Roseiflexus sp.]